MAVPTRTRTRTATRTAAASRLVLVSPSLTYSVPEVHCEACRTALRRGIGRVRGVETVDVDLDRKQVAVSGSGLDDAAIREAIDAAGFELG